MTAFEPHWVQRSATAVAGVLRPRTLNAALTLIAEDPSRRPVAGGTDLVVELDRESGAPVELIDLSAVDDLRWVAEEPAALLFGAGVTHNDVVGDDRFVDRALPLAQACLEIGSPQLRNRATVAGNLVTASPANDTISALMALDASVVLARWANGGIDRRLVNVADLFDGFRSTVLADDELVAAIHVPTLSASRRGLWVKLGLRKAQAISVVHAGFVVEFGDDGETVVDARIALGSVAPTVVLVEAAHDELRGERLEPSTIDRAARAAAAAVEPIDDGRATAEYRSHSIETMVRRALRAIAADAQARTWPNRVLTLGHRHPMPDAPLDPVEHHVEPIREIGVRINGADLQAPAEPAILLDWLREHAGTGTKEGCAEGECGACTVMLNGQAIMSCLTPSAQADQADIATVEGLAKGGALSAMQQSFVENFAVQCGYCIPGFVVAASALSEEIDNPTREEIEFGLSGNLCRCTGYYAIVEAVRAANEGPHTS